MSTVQTICSRALRRIGIVAAVDTPSAEDAASALAHLNEMMFGWAASSALSGAQRIERMRAVVFMVGEVAT